MQELSWVKCCTAPGGIVRRQPDLRPTAGLESEKVKAKSSLNLAQRLHSLCSKQNHCLNQTVLPILRSKDTPAFN